MSHKELSRNKYENGVIKEIVWKPIKGYEMYEISNNGDVRRNNHIISPFKTKNGYLIVVLSVNNVKHKFLVHRLVALNFIDNPNGFDFVNHKDENKLNNSIDNLEWCSWEYNNNYGTINIRRSINNIGKNKGCKQEYKRTYIRCIETGEVHFLNEWERLGVHNTRLVCLGKIKHSHGLHYEYVKGLGKL